MFDGFDKRLQKQVQGIINDRMKAYNKISGTNDTMDCTVAQNLVQRYAVWFGGSVLGSHEGFSRVCHSREAYLEHGPSICRQNAIFQE